MNNGHSNICLGFFYHTLYRNAECIDIGKKYIPLTDKRYSFSHSTGEIKVSV